MSSKRIRAKELLSHYLGMVARASGVRWDNDNRAEIDDIVDCIVEAAIEEMAECAKAEADAAAELQEAYDIHIDNRNRAKAEMDGLRHGMGLE